MQLFQQLCVHSLKIDSQNFSAYGYGFYGKIYHDNYKWVSPLEITNYMYAAFTVPMNECFDLVCKVTYM